MGKCFTLICLNLNQMLHSNVFQPKTNVHILMWCPPILSRPFFLLTIFYHCYNFFERSFKNKKIVNVCYMIESFVSLLYRYASIWLFCKQTVCLVLFSRICQSGLCEFYFRPKVDDFMICPQVSLIFDELRVINA